jgi:hypothetical protein
MSHKARGRALRLARKLPILGQRAAELGRVQRKSPALNNVICLRERPTIRADTSAIAKMPVLAGRQTWLE